MDDIRKFEEAGGFPLQCRVKSTELLSVPDIRPFAREAVGLLLVVKPNLEPTLGVLLEFFIWLAKHQVRILSSQKPQKISLVPRIETLFPSVSTRLLYVQI